MNEFYNKGKKSHLSIDVNHNIPTHGQIRLIQTV
jgi:hypothetical protein